MTELLLVDPDADRLATDVQAAEPRLRVAPATSLAAARAHLSGSAFDLVLAASPLPDGDPLQLFELGIAVPPVVVRAATAERAREAERGGAWMAVAAPPDARLIAALALWHAPREAAAAPEPPAAPAPLGGEDAVAVLRSTRDALARVVHESNNPLAVVSGNAQLARELLNAAPGDPAIAASLLDIQDGADAIAALMAEVTALRREVEAALSALG